MRRALDYYRVYSIQGGKLVIPSPPHQEDVAPQVGTQLSNNLRKRTFNLILKINISGGYLRCTIFIWFLKADFHQH